MLPRPIVFALLAGLAACQAGNPYQASHQPYPPAPNDPAAARQADPTSYPAAPRSFARHQHWQWATEVDETLAEIVSAELDRRGLRPATAQYPASLRLHVQQRSVVRQRQVYDDPYFGAGVGYYHPHHGYWAGTPYPLLRTVTERVEQVELEFRDARSGERLWQGNGEALREGRDARAQADALRRAVRQALDGFPPP